MIRMHTTHAATIPPIAPAANPPAEADALNSKVLLAEEGKGVGE